MLAINSEAPDFTLIDHHGKRITLSAFRSRQAVVLIFYPMDFTGGCTRQLCAIRDDYAAFQAAGAAVLGISAAPRLVHRAFATRNRYQFPLLADSNQAVARRYGTFDPARPLMNIRTVYVIDRDGRVVFAERGMPDDRVILAAVRGEAEEVQSEEGRG